MSEEDDFFNEMRNLWIRQDPGLLAEMDAAWQQLEQQRVESERRSYAKKGTTPSTGGQKKSKRPSHLRLVGRNAPAPAPAPARQPKRPKYDPDAEDAHLLELVEKFPAMGMESLVEDFRHHRRLLEQLVKAREEAGLTQAEVARRMGVPRSAIERLEIGAGNPYFSTIERYVSALGKKIEWEIK
jgi:DNA-binding XRE family transcriptional regulator